MATTAERRPNRPDVERRGRGRTPEGDGGCSGRAPGRAAVESRSGRAADAAREGLAQAQGTARLRVGGRDPAGLSRFACGGQKVTRVVRWAVVGVLLGVLSVAAWTYVSFHRPYKGYDAAEQFVEIPAGSGTTSMGRRLADAGVIRSAASFRVAVWIRGAGRRLQAGEYRFTEPMTLTQVVDKIARGDVYVRSITFREGLTVREMADAFQAGGFGSAAQFIAASKKASLIQHLDPVARDLEGYLFPDTYTMTRRANAEELVERMTKRFEKALAPEILQQAGAWGLNTRQLVTLASIVEKETGKAEERPTVAGVYTNRLKIGM